MTLWGQRIPLKLRKIQGQTLSKAVKAASSSLLNRPRTIALDTSSRCNLRCEMCSLHNQTKQGFMSLEVFDRLLDVFPTVTTVELYSSGEPLMNKDLSKMVKRIKDVSSSTSVEFYTNGMLLTENTTIDLVSNGLDRVTFSLDGATASTYEGIRHGAEFNKVLENIKVLSNVKVKLGKERPVIALAFVAMKKNVSELPSLVDLAGGLEISQISVNGLEPYSDNFKEEILYDDSDKTAQGYFEQATLRAKERGIALMLPRLKKATRRKCFVHKLALISWDGQVQPCPAFSYRRSFYYYGQRLSHEPMSFGDVKKKPFYDIWNSGDYRDFRHKIRQGNFPSSCDYCLLSYGLICPM